MRAIFGIAGVLIVIGVIVWIMSQTLSDTQKALKASEDAKQEVRQIAGLDSETGGRASESVDLQALQTGGRLSAILVTKVVPDGAYARYFGLQRNDTITAVEYQGTRMTARDSNDQEMFKAQIAEAYQRRGSVIVVRGGKELQLPPPPPAPPADGTDSPKPASNDPLQRQLDAIPGISR
jgi:hypothetical protein